MAKNQQQAKVLFYEKFCTKCRVTSPVSMFSKNIVKADGFHQWCKLCQKVYQRGWSLRSKFGITEDEYDVMLEAQGGKCAICRRPPAKNKLSVDHDHDNGRIRGILCPPCNRSVEWMIYNGERAKEYLNE